MVQINTESNFENIEIKNEPIFDSNETKKEGTEKPFHCNECQKSFQTKSGWNGHRYHYHSGRTFPCKICFKVFASLSTLNRHFTAIHEKIRFNCEMCNKSFSDRSGLKKHRRDKHSKTDNWCGICEVSIERMSEHMRQKHPEKVNQHSNFNDSSKDVFSKNNINIKTEF